MKRIYLLFWVCLLASCEENSGQVDTYLNIGVDSLFFGVEGGAQEVTVETNKTWTATSAANWLTLSGDSAVLQGKLVVDVEPRTSEERGLDVITVYSGALSKDLIVVQDAYVHPALQPQHWGELIEVEGNEVYTPLVSEPYSIAELDLCGDTPSSRSYNLVLMNDAKSTVSATWNHITTSTGEWEGVNLSPTDYQVSSTANYLDPGCNERKVFETVLVKKYGDWDHQHANGYILNLPAGDHYMVHMDKLILDLYYDSEKSFIPTAAEIAEAYNMSLSDVLAWDQGLFLLDIQLHTQEGTRAAIKIELPTSMADKWLHIEVPLEAMEITNSQFKTIKLEDIARHKMKEISMTAETGNRLVYRNINVNGFNENTAKLFKELGIRIKRLELYRVDPLGE